MEKFAKWWYHTLELYYCSSFKIHRLEFLYLVDVASSTPNPCINFAFYSPGCAALGFFVLFTLSATCFGIGIYMMYVCGLLKIPLPEINDNDN